MALIPANQRSPRAVWGQLVVREESLIIELKIWLRNQEASVDEMTWFLQDVLRDHYERISEYLELQVVSDGAWQVECTNSETINGLKSVTVCPTFGLFSSEHTC
jgi:hypothetical protein